MQKKKMIIAGGNGYLGKLLAPHLMEKGWEVVVLVRHLLPGPCTARQVVWNGETAGPWMAELEGAGALLNLAGRSVNCRYNRKNREAILNSRIRSTKILGEAIAACHNPPKAWLNSSSATIYRHAEDREMDEATGEIGHDFSMDICRAWEAALDEAVTPRTRKVALRSAMVMGPGSDGVFGAFHRLVRLKVGGTLGSGRQFVSWIHWEDFAAAIDWILENEHLTGAINVTSPNPLINREFMRILRETDEQKIGLPTPAWMLAFGAIFLRTETELVLKSRRVIPARLLADGFIFRHAHWEAAVRNLLRKPIHPLVADGRTLPVV